MSRSLSISLGLVLILLLSAACASPPPSDVSSRGPNPTLGSARGGQHESALGFSADLPSSWIAVTADNVARADRLRGEGETPIRLSDAMQRIVERGDIEFFYPSYAQRIDISENVNIVYGEGGVPSSDTAVQSNCAAFPSLFSSLYGRPITVQDCGTRSTGEHLAFYVRSDGHVVGTQQARYLVPAGEGKHAVFTAVAAPENIDRLDNELVEFLETLRFDAR